MWEKIRTLTVWCISLAMAWLGDLSLKDISTYVGMVLGVVMVLISWYYKHQTLVLLRRGKITREEYDAANR
ncbi:HP1 family phage holin [Rosenbergiella collisarenosi]|uniref:HP1 family phage holin n=1 Tax=Rosenbergiella collisarenosi TaxID=1544695 RepID=UPI001F4FB73D|nr:HP1 family phage holin [Rosenbergiella collisarenosi]